MEAGYEPGEILFLESNEYEHGGYPVVFEGNPKWREDVSVVLHRATPVSASSQLVPSSILRKMTGHELDCFYEDVQFLLEKYEKFHKGGGSIEVDFDSARRKLAKAFNEFVEEGDPEKKRDALRALGTFIGLFLGMHSESDGYGDLSDEVKINFDF